MSRLPRITANRVTVGEWTLVNLTPHPITVHMTEGGVTTVAAAPAPARVAYQTTEQDTEAPWPMVTEAPLATIGLPNPKPGVLLVVSRPVATDNPDRTDLMVPTRPVRDAQGRVVAARALARLTPAH